MTRRGAASCVVGAVDLAEAVDLFEEGGEEVRKAAEAAVFTGNDDELRTHRRDELLVALEIGRVASDAVSEPGRVPPGLVLPDCLDGRELELVGDRRRLRVFVVDRVALGIEAEADLASRTRPPSRLRRHRTHVVHRFRDTEQPSAAQLAEMHTVRRDEVAAARGVRNVRGRSAVHLVERAFTEDARDVDTGRRTDALPQIQVCVTPTCHREAVVEGTEPIQQLARDEHAVALDDAVEPIAVADEMPDLEQPVSVDRPADAREQVVFGFLVVARMQGVALLARADIPLLRRDDRRRVRLECGHTVLQDAGRQHVRAVDHERDVPPAGDGERHG